MLKKTFSLMWNIIVFLLIFQQGCTFSLDWRTEERFPVDSYGEETTTSEVQGERTKLHENRMRNKETPPIADEVVHDRILNYKKGSQKSVEPVQFDKNLDMEASSWNRDERFDEGYKQRDGLRSKVGASKSFAEESNTERPNNHRSDKVHPLGSINLLKSQSMLGHKQSSIVRSKLQDKQNIEDSENKFKPVILPKPRPTSGTKKKSRKKGISGPIVMVMAVFGMLLASVLICGFCAKINPRFAAWLSRRDKMGYMPLKKKQKKAHNRRMVNRKSRDAERGNSTGNVARPSYVYQGAKSDSALPEKPPNKSTTASQNIVNGDAKSPGYQSTSVGRNNEGTVTEETHFAQKSPALSNGDKDLLASSGDDDARSKRQRDAVAIEIPSSDDAIQRIGGRDTRAISMIYAGVNSCTDDDSDMTDSECDESIAPTKLSSLRYFFHRVKAKIAALLSPTPKLITKNRLTSKESGDEIVVYDKQLYSSFIKGSISEPEPVQIDIRELSNGTVNSKPDLNLGMDSVHDNCRTPDETERSLSKTNTNIGHKSFSFSKKGKVVELLGTRTDHAFMYSLKQYSKEELHVRRPVGHKPARKERKKRRDKAPKRIRSSYHFEDDNRLYADLSGQKRRKLEKEFFMKQLDVNVVGGNWKSVEGEHIVPADKTGSQEKQDGRLLENNPKHGVECTEISAYKLNAPNSSCNKDGNSLDQYQPSSPQEKCLKAPIDTQLSAVPEIELQFDVEEPFKTAAIRRPNRADDDAAAGSVVENGLNISELPSSGNNELELASNEDLLCFLDEPSLSVSQETAISAMEEGIWYTKSASIENILACETDYGNSSSQEKSLTGDVSANEIEDSALLMVTAVATNTKKMDNSSLVEAAEAYLVDGMSEYGVIKVMADSSVEDFGSNSSNIISIGVLKTSDTESEGDGKPEISDSNVSSHAVLCAQKNSAAENLVIKSQENEKNDDEDKLWSVSSLASSSSESCSTLASIECSSIEDFFNDISSAEFVISRQVTDEPSCSNTSSNLPIDKPKSPRSSWQNPFYLKSNLAKVKSDSGIHIRGNGLAHKKSLSEADAAFPVVTGPKENINTRFSNKSIQTNEVHHVDKKRWKFVRRMFRKKKTRNSQDSKERNNNV